VISTARSLLQESVIQESTRSDTLEVADASTSIVIDDYSYGNQQNPITCLMSSIDNEFEDEEPSQVDGDELNQYFLHHFEDDITNNFFTQDGTF